MAKKIEAEGGELVLTNKHGDTIIIPKNKRKEALSHLKNNNHKALDNIAATLPLMQHYAADGSLYPDNELVQNKRTNKKPALSAEEYQKDIDNYYKNNIEDNNYRTFTHYSDKPSFGKGWNCIHGVCSFIDEAAPGVLKKKYTGNINWQDEYVDSNYVRQTTEDVLDNGFPNGTILQYGDTRGDYISGHDNQASANYAHAFDNLPPEEKARKLKQVENDFIGTHAIMTMSNYVDDDGEKHYIVYNNNGTENGNAQDMTETELMKRFTDKTYNSDKSGYSLLRAYAYDPSLAEATKHFGSEEKAKIAGYNKHAAEYQDENNGLNFTGVKGINLETLEPDSFFDGSLNDSDDIDKYINVYNDHYNELGKGSDLSKSTLNKLLRKQIGIAWKESQLNEDLLYQAKEALSDKQINRLRSATGGNSSDNWMQEYWKDNAYNIQKKFKTFEDFKKDELKTQKKFNKKNDEKRSSGPWQQKYLSARGKYHKYDISSKVDAEDRDFGTSSIKDGVNMIKDMYSASKGTDNFDNFALASASLAIDNYHELRKRHPHWSEEKLIDMTTLMHSAPGKVNSKRYVQYFYDDKHDVNTINDINKAVNALTKNNTEN